jgi:hypothetical protein
LSAEREKEILRKGKRRKRRRERNRKGIRMLQSMRIKEN